MTRRVHPAWKTLGIEPTSDTRAIRLAYSTKLKAIDPEGDPAAFVALRHAFEIAQNVAAAAASIEKQRVESKAAASTPAPVQSADPAQTHARALSSVLYVHDEDDEPWLSASERADAFKHWEALVSDPRMAEISFFADVERWASELIAATSPRSVDLLAPACQTFGWSLNAEAVGQTPAILEVVRRYRSLQVLEAAQQPGHSHHRAWVELTKPTSAAMNRGWVSGRKVHELLTRIRDVAPEMENRFDRLRVGLWQSHAGPMPRRMKVWLAIGGWLVIVTILYATGSIR